LIIERLKPADAGQEKAGYYEPEPDYNAYFPKGRRTKARTPAGKRPPWGKRAKFATPFACSRQEGGRCDGNTRGKGAPQKYGGYQTAKSKVPD